MEDIKTPCTSEFTPPAPVYGQFTDYQKVKLPTPRTFNGRKYYGTDDVAKIIGVSKQAVWKWQTELYFGCPLFTADERAHDGRYLYDVERVMQLKAVYRANWTRGSYEPNIKTPAAMHDHNPAQILQNLPQELLKQPRFFALVGNKKEDLPQEWSNPDKQQFFCDIPQDKLVGFDTCGHGRAADYLFLDFDHILDDNGNFVNENAELCFNQISSIAPTFTEKSISEHGLHKIFKPTPNKFSPISAGTKGTLYFDDKRTKNSPKLEIFYGSKGRYCFFTGNLFNCEPNAPIASGEKADEVFQSLINQIKKQQPAAPQKKSAPTAQATKFLSDSMEYDEFRAGIMLDCIVPADLPDTDWLAVQSAAKNIGIPYPVVDAWNQQDQNRYNEKQNQMRWDSLDDPSFDISTLHGIAKRFGYQEKDARRQWYQLHPNLKPSNQRAKTIAPELQREFDDAIIFLETLTPDDFTADDAHNPDNIRAVAIAHYFGFTKQAENFFNVIKKAKNIARNRIKEANDGLTETLSDNELAELNALIEGTDIKNLRNAINREATAIAKSQAEYLKAQEIKQKKERAEKARIAETSRLIEQQSRIDQLRQMPPSPQRDAELVQLISNSCEWKYDKLGNPIAVKATAKNLDLIFTYDPTLDGLIGYDEFRQADVFLKVPTWRKDKGNCIHEEVTDQDAAQIRNHLCRIYSELANKNRIDDWLVEFSNKFSFHEVKEFFRNLPKWDGKPRAKKFFVNFLRADDTPYVHEVTMNWLTAAVCRIFHPGCEYQLAPILVGEQGIGKSYSVSQLGGKWYGSLIDDVADPHAVDAIQNLWLVEIKEMAAMKKDVDANKRFIDAKEDNRRKAYERRATKTKRHCVFIVTTNNQQCLIDMTGNRRHPIIKCNAKPRAYVEGLTKEYIEQVWAEVLQHCKEIFKDGFDEKKLELSKAAQIQSDEIAEQFTRDDLTEDIKSFLDTKIPPLSIWHQLTREERRKFFAEGNIKLVDGECDLYTRIRATFSERKAQQLINEIDSFLRKQNNGIKKHHIKRNGEDLTELWIYGTQDRQHICPQEILHEAFATTDRRKSIPKIIESLNKLDDWTQGERFRRIDPAYNDQKIVYYRNNETQSD